MPYKDLLVYVDANPATSQCLDMATSFAAAYDAHLVALHVMAPPYVPADVSGAVPVQLIEWQEEFARQQAAKAEAEVGAAERRSGRAIEWRCVKGDVGDSALLHARHVDLAMIMQAAEDDDQAPAGDLAETLALGAGRPVLVVPRYGKFRAIAENVLVAWNQTREATRAVHDALPILKRAKSVTIMEVNPEQDDTPRVAGADIAGHLARHGIKAEAASTTATDIEVGDVILSRAADLSSDLIVMGAYGHSRLREYVLGGATLHLLRHMTVPVLMSH